MDTRLRQLIRDAQISNDLLVAYQAAAYAVVSGQLVDERHDRINIDTEHGPVEITCNTHYNSWARRARQAHLRLFWQDVTLSHVSTSGSWNTSTFEINGRSIFFRFNASLPELLFGVPEAGHVHPANRDRFPPARRVQIAQLIVNLVRPFVESAEGATFFRNAAVSYLQSVVAGHIREIAGKEDQVARLQHQTAAAYLNYLKYKQTEYEHGGRDECRLNEREFTVLDANEVELAYQEVKHLYVTGQLAEIDYTAINRDRNTVVPTPYGPINVHKMPGGMNVNGKWNLGAPEGDPDADETILSFRFEVQNYGIQGDKFSALHVDSRKFARDNMRYGASLSRYSQAVPKEERRRLAKLICDHLEEYFKPSNTAGVDFSVRAQRNILLVNVQQYEENIQRGLREIARIQAETGEAFLDMLTIEAGGELR